MDQSEHDAANNNPILTELAAMTPAEKDAFLSQVRADGRMLTSEEQYALLGPPREEETATTIELYVEPMVDETLEQTDLVRLAVDFFP